MNSHAMTQKEIEKCLSAGQAFEKADEVKKGEKYHLWTKRGSDMDLITVHVISDVYSKKTGRGVERFVDVYGYGFRGAVKINRLMKRYACPNSQK